MSDSLTVSTLSSEPTGPCTEKRSDDGPSSKTPRPDNPPTAEYHLSGKTGPIVYSMSNDVLIGIIPCSFKVAL
jgi:hypothetical protein